MIRNLSLQEWFLAYQLDFIERNYCHIGGVWDIDLTKLQSTFNNDGKDFALTAILTKAIGIWQRECPAINRQRFKTFSGPKFYSCDSLAVNVPALLKSEGQPYLSVLTIQNPHKKSVDAIKQEISEYTKTDPKTLPVAKFLIGRRNHVLNRLRMRIIHFLVNKIPSIQQRFEVGTISLSSLLSSTDQTANVTYMAKGPGSMSLTVCSYDKTNAHLRVGFSWDHATANGYEAVAAGKVFCSILQGDRQELFKELCQ
ncbi:MAG: hypothetical protein MI867_20630 [Pseudomonadales bacterium]|nr:hypothetical protein [Pseudomonadales bacterium]